MSFLKNLFGKRSQTESLHPRCSSCGGVIPLKLPARAGVTSGGATRTLPWTGELPKGTELFEGTECTACGQIYCLDCHDFAVKGPKCPNCGQWNLMPIMRVGA
jgi:rRNA maturation protein Nop10